MIQRNAYPEMVSSKEAAHFCKFITGEEISTCYDLYGSYRQFIGERHKKLPLTYDAMLAAAFFYTVGRVQGIREERAKKKSKKIPILNIPMMSDEKWEELAKKYAPVTDQSTQGAAKATNTL